MSCKGVNKSCEDDKQQKSNVTFFGNLFSDPKNYTLQPTNYSTGM